MQDDNKTFRRSVESQNDNSLLQSSNTSSSYNEYRQNPTSNASYPQQSQDYQIPTTSEIGTRLIPIGIDMYKRKNMEEHSTIYYDIDGLVLRRGQAFLLSVTFNQDFNADRHYISVIFKCQTWLNSSEVKIPLNNSSNEWSAKRVFTGDGRSNCVCLQINSPSDALIGKYSIFLEICPIERGLLNKRALSIFQFEIDIYFLFNPWQKFDSCGLLSSEQIAEYVMNEHGQIYLGLSDIPRYIPWHFGQFERVVLLTALALLNKVQLSAQQRIDSSVILRILASKICSEYGSTDGIFPSSFDVLPLCQENEYTSSPTILKLYLASNSQSIHGNSGSNWQHAAVFCSLCRSLGIPCRIVTVYNAACQVQERRNTDMNLNRGQQTMVVVNSKITRPWYLWNECWIRRDDLPRGNSGWQVVDPSSIQYGIQRIGPCSVAALKSNKLSLKWDTPEISSILDGSQTYWLVDQKGNRKLIKVEENVINTRILTKSLQNEQPYEDVTSSYKLIIAPTETTSIHDVDIEVKTPHSLKCGDDLHLTLITNNRSNRPRTLTISAAIVRINCIDHSEPIQEETLETFSYNYSTHSSTYNIDSQTPHQSYVQTFPLVHQQQKFIQIKLQPTIEDNKRCLDSALKIYIRGTINETNQSYIREKYILHEQDISMKLTLENNVAEIGKVTKLTIKISNPTSKTINHGHITVDGFGVSESIQLKIPISSNETATFMVPVTPMRLGLGRFYVSLTTDSIHIPPYSIQLLVTDPRYPTIPNTYKPDTQQQIPKQNLINDQDPALLSTQINVDAYKDTPQKDQRLNDDQQLLQTIYGSLPDTQYLPSQESQEPLSTSYGYQENRSQKSYPPEIFTIQPPQTATNTIDKPPDIPQPFATIEPTENISQSIQDIKYDTELIQNRPEHASPIATTNIIQTLDIQPPQLQQTNTAEQQPIDDNQSSLINTKPDDTIQPPAHDQELQIIQQTETEQPKHETKYSPTVDRITDTILNILQTQATITKTPQTNDTINNLTNLDTTANMTTSIDSAGETISQTPTAHHEEVKHQQHALEKAPLVEREAEGATVEHEEVKHEEHALEKAPSVEHDAEATTATPAVEHGELKHEEHILEKAPSVEQEAKPTTVAHEEVKHEEHVLEKAPSVEREAQPTAETIHTEEEVKHEEHALEKAPSVEHEAEAAPVEREQLKHEQHVLEKAPSVEKEAEPTAETTHVEEYVKHEERVLEKAPSVEREAEAATESTHVEEEIKPEEHVLEKAPSVERKAEAATVEHEEVKHEEHILEKAPSIEPEAEPTIAEHEEVNHEEHVLDKAPSVEHEAEAAIIEHEEVKHEEHALEKAPSVERKAEAATVEHEEVKHQEHVLEKAPSVEHDAEAATASPGVEHGELKHEEHILEKAPSVEQEAEATTVEHEEDKHEEHVLEKAPSTEHDAEATTATPAVEHEEVKHEEHVLEKAPSTEHDAEATTATPAVEHEEVKHEEHAFEKARSVEHDAESAGKTPAVEHEEVKHEEHILEKAPSAEHEAEPTAETIHAEEKVKHEEHVLEKAPSVEHEPATIEHEEVKHEEVKREEHVLEKAPSVEREAESTGETPAVEEEVKDEEHVLEKAPSTEREAEPTVAEHQEVKHEEHALEKAPLVEHETEPTGETPAVEDEDVKHEEHVLEKVPSVEREPESSAEASHAAEEIKQGEPALEKAPSVGREAEPSAETTLVQEETKHEEHVLEKAPSVEHEAEPTGETPVVEDEDVKHEEHVLGKAPSAEHEAERTSHISGVEERLAPTHDILEEVRSTNRETESTTETSALQEEAEHEEHVLEKAPSVEHEGETPAVEHEEVKHEEHVLEKAPSVEREAEPTGETPAVEHEENKHEEHVLEKAPSVEHDAEATTASPAVEHEEVKHEEHVLEKAASVEREAEPTGETPAVEHEEVKHEEHVLEKAPSVEHEAEPTGETPAVEREEVKHDEHVLEKAPSVEHEAEPTGETPAVEREEVKHEEHVLEKAPSVEHEAEPTGGVSSIGAASRSTDGAFSSTCSSC
ncbi:unnamed protein product, partial [Adineta steineri]